LAVGLRELLACLPNQHNEKAFKMHSFAVIDLFTTRPAPTASDNSANHQMTGPTLGGNSGRQQRSTEQSAPALLRENGFVNWR
jgi:hypothetical protein